MLVLQKNDPLAGSFIWVWAIGDAFYILFIFNAQVLWDFELDVKILWIGWLEVVNDLDIRLVEALEEWFCFNDHLSVLF